MDADKGVYMIAYNDNANTIALKNHLQNNETNRELLAQFLEASIGIPKNSLQLISIKDYYWQSGTHYYKPLDYKKYKSRDEFVKLAQHPTNGILVVGEVVSRNQGWVEGALKSVKEVIGKKWIDTKY
jgi:monoamine oxidase